MSHKQLTDRQKELVQCSKYINTYWKQITDKHQHRVLFINEFNKFTEILWRWGKVLDEIVEEDFKEVNIK